MDIEALFANAVIVAVALVLVVSWSKFWKNIRRSKTSGPILSSNELLGTGGLQGVHKGTMQGYNYVVLTNSSNSVMVSVDLGFNTGVHILACGKKAKPGSENMMSQSKQTLEPMHLEGDFSKYFRMYCTPGKERELLRVFAPDTMAHFADFCQAYNFEIYRESLFVSRAHGYDDRKDSTSLMTDLDHFLKENGRTLSRLNPSRTRVE
jgi:hypothetical protein